MTDANNRVVVVTGAAGALGEHVVAYFSERHERVVCWDLHAAGHGKLVEAKDRRGVWEQQVNVTDAQAIATAAASVREELGPIDVLVHCAGGFRWSKIDAIAPDAIDFLVDVNLRSSLYMVREVMGSMKSRGYGRVVLISSRSTLKPAAGEGAYAATKAGLNALVSAVADEVKGMDVTINAVQPSIIDTEANRQDMPDADFDSWVDPGELASIIYGLCPVDEHPINGALLVVSGRT
ncbi:SDR family NAD(P)-dependent oxidoreductase [Bradymonadaceae bacterium TMQ3]|uniref:SDR family NAD(P)-dependent oxidoreductase n=1 Tax=Lujinxingia sediminis TaxID=2480984 RepID=A0ABY0CNF5_9DELT|nr:SDR family NAD(P)-dependent oxidoreductase [Lujinxingia sediminis]RDV36383.1 SDR family NAD(P)-dependent oxidoreductase [Bradymonadaceae bacterium TMQ3]RVU41482.1 SDR family NAD(P)-dependent oxidoreductase [Lujinxingia sediminis]TXC68472.1 SDR family NAD(P)-dependent oxidoreductase [Bradymonadales bacterium TMQ1]